MSTVEISTAFFPGVAETFLSATVEPMALKTLRLTSCAFAEVKETLVEVLAGLGLNPEKANTLLLLLARLLGGFTTIL
jgi:uncharacterized membrane protein YqjE